MFSDCDFDFGSAGQTNHVYSAHYAGYLTRCHHWDFNPTGGLPTYFHGYVYPDSVPANIDGYFRDARASLDFVHWPVMGTRP